MAKDLPKYIVVVTYAGHTIQKGKKSDPSLREAKRFLYIYDGESLDERIGKAWRVDAKAEVFECSHKHTHSVAASETRDIWA